MSVLIYKSTKSVSIYIFLGLKNWNNVCNFKLIWKYALFKEVERKGGRTKANERLLYCSLFSFVKGLFRLN